MALAGIGINNVVDQRITQQIQDQLGAPIMALLNDDAIFEVHVNGDGSVRTSGMGRKDHHPEIVLTPQQRLSFLGTIASLEHVELNKSTPIIDGVLPWDGSRISGCIPPADLNGPSYNIRKKAKKVFTLDDYIAQGRVTQEEKELIHKAIRDRKNILVAGPTGSGKTTMTNALIHALYEISPHERIITMEQVPELQVSHEDWVGMQTTDTVNFAQLIRNALRRSPDRIIIGEVRDQAAMDLLEAWYTMGEYPSMSISEARELLPVLRKRAADGIIIDEEKAAEDMRFRVFAEKWALDHDSRLSTEQGREKTRQRMRNHIIPDLGEMIITEIKPKDVLAIMQRLAAQEKFDMMTRVRAIISMIFRFAAANGYDVTDQTTALRGAITAPKASTSRP